LFTIKEGSPGNKFGMWRDDVMRTNLYSIKFPNITDNDNDRDPGNKDSIGNILEQEEKP